VEMFWCKMEKKGTIEELKLLENRINMLKAQE
jgi:hypothetical protein